jgi:signal peptidase I
MAAILGMAAIGVWAALTGQVGYVITVGVSMNPIYHQGDLVVTAKKSSYQVGDIAAYRAPGQSAKILHRIIEQDPAGKFVFKGDNNQSIDPFHSRSDQILGEAILHIPHGGVWLKPILSPTTLGMMGFLIVGSGAMLPRNRREIPRGRRKKRVKAMSQQGSPLVAILKIAARLSPAMRVAAGFVAVLGCGALVLGVLGWMKPLAVQEIAAGTAESMTFSYSAQVPESPAYDTTVVSSPEPIFRRLTDKVTLKMHYRGRPGTLASTVTLSTPSGWHSSMSLTAAKKFTGPSTDATATLELKNLEGRANDAAKAIGIPTGSITVMVIVTVTTTDADPFTAQLNLQLDPVQMRLSGSVAELVVSDVPAKTTVAREIGSVMTASQARAYSVLLLLAFVIAAIAIALMARRQLPCRTRPEIERRYPNLLVHVEPMASPPGKPVVNVDNFPALVRLSEKYGQMILTWRRPDADDFVVRDEGITYRYRVPLDDEPTLQNVDFINRTTSGTHRRKEPTQAS